MICLHHKSEISYYIKKYDTSDYYVTTPPFVKDVLTDMLMHSSYSSGVKYVEGNFVVPLEYLGRIQ